VGECKQIERMAGGLAKRTFTIPWLTVPPIGFAELSKLVGKRSAAAPAPAGRPPSSFRLPANQRAGQP